MFKLHSYEATTIIGFGQLQVYAYRVVHHHISRFLTVQLVMPETSCEIFERFATAKTIYFQSECHFRCYYVPEILRKFLWRIHYCAHAQCSFEACAWDISRSKSSSESSFHIFYVLLQHVASATTKHVERALINPRRKTQH